MLSVGGNVYVIIGLQCLRLSQEQHVQPLLFFCWVTVYDANPAKKQH